jgi:hypothetical protein
LAFKRKEGAMLDNLPDPLGDMLCLLSVAEQRLEAAIGHGDAGQIQDWVKRIADLDRALRQYGIEVDARGRDLPLGLIQPEILSEARV